MLEVQHYYALVHLLQRETSLARRWQALLDLADQPSQGGIELADIEDETIAVADQLRCIWAQEPVPAGATFLYFGLYDLVAPGQGGAQTGFYVSGDDGDPMQRLESGKLGYFPTHRHLHSNVLNRIKTAASQFPEQAAVLDYTVMLGCAAILASHAVESLKIALPVYVGFDSGDYLLASAQ